MPQTSQKASSRIKDIVNTKYHNVKQLLRNLDVFLWPPIGTAII